MTEKKTAAQAEAEGVEMASVQWRDLTLAFPADPEEWDIEVTEAFEDGKVVTAVRGLLGPSQWAAVKALHPKNKDLSGLYDALAQAMGMTSAGE